MNEADSSFPNVEVFVKRLRDLRYQRLDGKTTEVGLHRSLTPSERLEVLKKSGGKCHICGGEISNKWVADHVFARINGGKHTLENFLPAHAVCNRAKWFYGTEEFQWILKMGVYFRTQLEEQSDADAVKLAEAFIEHEKRRIARRKTSRATLPD